MKSILTVAITYQFLPYSDACVFSIYNRCSITSSWNWAQFEENVWSRHWRMRGRRGVRCDPPPLLYVVLRWCSNCMGRGPDVANLISKSWGGGAEEAICVFVVGSQEEPGMTMLVKLTTGNGPSEKTGNCPHQSIHSKRRPHGTASKLLRNYDVIRPKFKAFCGHVTSSLTIPDDYKT